MWNSALTFAIVINELMASNAGSVMSPAINFDSWMELYNPTEQPIDLAGMYLSNNENNLMHWQMPSDIGSIPAKGYLVVWLGSNDIKSNQAPFKLDCDGGTVYLSDQNGQLVTSMQYPQAKSRTVYARTTDGGEEWGWTATPTPGASNATSEFASERLNAPLVNEDSKLFKEAFDIQVTFPEGTHLRYTTNGSLPTATDEESEDGVFHVTKTTNYVFRLFKDGYLPSVPVTRSYIRTQDTYTLPIISIVGDKSYFSDPKIGIDCEGDGTNGKTGNGETVPRNYNMDWDRPVNFSYLSPQGEMLFNQDVNICVSGGWTRKLYYRSFKLKSNKAYDGQNRFDYSFFRQKPYTRQKVLLLRNGGNDMFTHRARFMDPALETIIHRSGIDIDVQSYQPVIEYVNGVLRGVFNLREPNNANYAYANWGYDDDELDSFENLKMKTGNDSVIKRIFELGYNATDDAAYEELKTLLDIDEFTNYMAATMYLDNDDWPNNNMKGYRSRNNGRYRFVSFDLDYAFSLRYFNTKNDNPFAYILQFKDAERISNEGNPNREVVRLWFNLLEREDYRRKFIDTFSLMGGSVFETNRATAIVNELLAEVKPMCDLMKKRQINQGNEAEASANTIKSKLKGRAKKMANHMKSFTYFDLKTTAVQEVAINTDTQGASLYINGMEVPYADFNGFLFAPVKLSVKAPAGYRFAGWKKGDELYSSHATIDLPTDTKLKFTATFTPLSDAEREAQNYTPVCINEVSASNSIYVNEYFKRNDWIELYNNTDQDIDVEGMFLSDTPENPTKFEIVKTDSVETVIYPHSHLIVWCDKLVPKSQLHATFKLAAEGGDVLLTSYDQTWTNRLTYTSHKGDQTVGRYPDGSNTVYVLNRPTIAKPNTFSSYAVLVSGNETEGISDMMTQQQDTQQVYNLRGQAVQGTLKPGIYIKNGKKIIIQ